MSEPRATTYWDFIRVDDLIALQGGLADDETKLSNEEVLFITVHQVFELWFKLILRELRSARDLFQRERVAEQELSGVADRLARVTTIFRVATHHFEVVETLGTREYLEFRDKLMPASGFQSAQMRMMEILLGLEESERIPFGAEGSYMAALLEPDGSESPSMARVKAQLADTPTLKEAIDGWLYRTPIDGVGHDAPGADEHLQAFIERFLAAHGAESDASAQRAMSLTRNSADVARLRTMYAKERESLHAFLNPSEEEGGRRRARIRTAMLFIETYRDLPLLAWPREILSAVIALEQAFLVFRQRHARMVERVIGRRTGTGGSSGVQYLDDTALAYRIFRDLWAVRAILLKPSATPPIENPGFYGFRAGN
ncbi:MAG: tryptophan 2,3-dioxygenase [Planctomycetota bacterium]|nr:MAG: tryptophan 2,3-dioxygenase [Planctomycetota bacterium]